MTRVERSNKTVVILGIPKTFLCWDMTCKRETDLSKVVRVKVTNQFKSKHLFPVMMHSTWRQRWILYVQIIRAGIQFVSNCSIYEIKTGHNSWITTSAINCAKMEIMRTSELQRYFIKGIHHLFTC